MKKEELSATKSPLEKKVETLMEKVNLLSDFIKYLVGIDDFPINRIFDGVDFDAIRQDFYGKDLAPLPEEM